MIRFSPDDDCIAAVGGGSGQLILWDFGGSSKVKDAFPGIKNKHKEIVTLQDQDEDQD